MKLISSSEKASNCCSYSYELVRINTFVLKLVFLKQNSYCSNCDLIIDRDVNGTRNIFIKFVNEIM